MHPRCNRRAFAIPFALAVIVLVASPHEVRAQPSEEIEDRAQVLHRLIFDVESRHRVLVRSRGALIAISADQVGELFASQVLSGKMPVDSIVPYARAVRERSNTWLQEIKRELVRLEGEKSIPTDAFLRWHGTPGTWTMTCEGSYPPSVGGDVTVVRMTQPANRARWLQVELTRGRLQAFVASLSGTVVNNSASGEARPVEMPGNDFNDVGTLGWDAYVEVTQPAVQGADGGISARGALSYSGNDGNCRGTWRTP